MRKPRKSSEKAIGVLPAVAASAAVFSCYCILNLSGTHDRQSNSDPSLQAAGFLAFQSSKTFRRQEKRREGRGSQSELSMRLPDPASVEAAGHRVEPLYADKSLHAIEQVWEVPKKTGSGWTHLNAEVRSKIDAPGPEPKRWDNIVLHQSSTSGGNASMLSMYHRKVRGLERGLAYHFVIGNGRFSRAGGIEVGDRWATQAPQGIDPSGTPDPRSISICLIGDFSLEPPSAVQMAALDELIQYLQAKLGHCELRPHSRPGNGSSSCPGRYFPRDTLIERFNPSLSPLALSSIESQSQ